MERKTRRKWGLNEKTLEELADLQIEKQNTEGFHKAVSTEFLYRQTKAIEDQARAAEATARHTQLYTTYMLLTVLAMLAALVVSLFQSCA